MFKMGNKAKTTKKFSATDHEDIQGFLPFKLEGSVRGRVFKIFEPTQ